MKFLRKFFQRTSIFLLLTDHLISFIQFFSYSRAVSPALSCTIFFRNIDQFSCTVFLNLYEKFLRQNIFSIQICHAFSPFEMNFHKISQNIFVGDLFLLYISNRRFYVLRYIEFGSYHIIDFFISINILHIVCFLADFDTVIIIY